MPKLRQFHHLRLLSLVLPALFVHTPDSAALEPAGSCRLAAHELLLTCDLRPMSADPVSAVAVTSDGAPVPHVYTPHATRPDASTAILLLIDTSDPARRMTVDKAKMALAELVTAAGPRHKLGLAIFSADLAVVAPLPSEPASVMDGFKNVAAKGHATELHRNLLDAIRLLEGFQADRRFLLVVSDGKAEDTAYRLDDVIAAARKAEIAVVGLGYVERASQTAHLQSLRRLADVTGGWFAAADPATRVLPDGFIAALLPRMDNGGRVAIDLKGKYGPTRLDIAMTTGGSPISRIEPVDLPPAPTPPAPPTLIERIRNQPLLALAAGGGLFVLLGLALLVARSRRKAAEPPFYAWLIELDGGGTRHPLRTTAARLGRNRDNDVVFKNDSISGHHAEIQRQRDGTFIVTDLASTNGVFLNSEKVERANLSSGDLIEIGEVRLRFETAVQ